MAHSNGRKPKREYGTGCLIQRGRRWAIRWREPEIAPDGTRRQVLRYESLGSVTRQQARALLAQRLASRMTAQAMRSCVPFKTLAEEWRKTVVPMYKHSTQKNHRHVLDKHLIPWFGDRAMHEITRQEVQGYVAHLVRQEYAPRSIDHIHDILSALLRTAVKWGHLNANPAREVDLPTLRNVRPKWAMSVADAKALVDALPLLPKTMVALDCSPA